MKKILAITYGGGHSNIVIALQREALKTAELNFCVLALTVASKQFAKHGLPFVQLSRYEALFSDIIDEVDMYGCQIAKEWHNPLSGIAWRESVLYFGLSMYDLVGKVGVKNAWHLLKEEGRNAFFPTTIADRIIQFESPDVILATTSPRMEKAFLYQGGMKNIKTIRIDDFFGISHQNQQKSSYWDGVLTNSSITVVPNLIAKQNLICNNIPEHTIRVIGNPAFDVIIDNISTLQFREHIRKVFFWAADTSIFCHELFEKLLIVMENYPDGLLVFKQHPNDLSNFYDKRLESYQYLDRIKKSNIESHILVRSADVVITQISTVGYEALLLDKPLLILSSPLNEKGFCYSKIGLAPKADTVNDIICNLNRLSDNKDSMTQELANIRKDYILHKKSAPEIIELIQEL